jgi:hypothetical protein
VAGRVQQLPHPALHLAVPPRRLCQPGLADGLGPAPLGWAKWLRYVLKELLAISWNAALLLAHKIRRTI